MEGAVVNLRNSTGAANLIGGFRWQERLSGQGTTLGKIYSITLLLTIGTFLLVQLSLIFTKVISKKRNQESDRGYRTWEWVWTSIPAAILLALALLV